jgi:hypothetical protein
MKPRHAAALALVGWYLMFPTRAENDQPDLESPLSSWYNGKTFSSLPECEDAVKKMVEMTKDPNIRGTIEAQMRAKIQARSSNLALTPAEWVEFRKALESSRCVASDDQRLKGN